jgi:aminobenzoyl-glutamate utilization protein B
MVACLLVAAVTATGTITAQQTPPTGTTQHAKPTDPRIERLKTEALSKVEGRAKQIQEMVDMVFSFGELGMQEFETSKYLTGILEQNGFTVERGVAGIPTAWVARWGSGKPVIALGSDIDCIPQASNKPAVAWHDPLIEGAPGHGEGHNSGQAVNIAAALAVKEIMQRENMPGTLMLWPGVAEEELAGKAFLVRAGVFKDVDVALFTHVGDDLGVSWGAGGQSALISADFRFEGISAHAAGAPWRGRSALDAVMLMGQAWEFRREHIRPQARVHYVIKDGGDQPNVVPSRASVWFYFREEDYDKTMELFETAKRIAQGAALMTDTKLAEVRVLGSAWDGHFNKPIAEATYENIKRVGLPEWTENDQAFARAVQTEVNAPTTGLRKEVAPLRGRETLENWMGGGSDDIGDVSWNVPTVTLRYPANIPGLPGHMWANAIAMATPVAHKGTLAGAKVQALTLIDLLTQPQVIADAWTYFRDVQTKDRKYKSFLSPTDQPPTFLNAETMAKYRPAMRALYYNPSKYSTYLEQLGIKYPTLKPKSATNE